MARAEIFNVPPAEAVESFRAKGFHVGWDWRDTDAIHHARSFTVAKAMRLDLLQDIRAALDKAIADGESFGAFRDRLEPVLRAKGWWGTKIVDGKPVQLGSLHRLRIIFDTNMRTAYARGHWESIERNAAAMPWLRYVATLDDRTRPQHRAWHGVVLRYDDPFWRTHYPPNGWNCRCTVLQYSDADLRRRGLAPTGAPPMQRRPWLNKRTGRVEGVPVGIDPGFSFNAGRVDLGKEASSYLIAKIDAAPARYARRRHRAPADNHPLQAIRQGTRNPGRASRAGRLANRHHAGAHHARDGCASARCKAIARQRPAYPGASP